MSRTSVLLIGLVAALPASASADAIMPYDGHCPPGLERMIINHAEACQPIVCEDDSACGEGASCATLCVCRAEREIRGEGRVVFPEPRTVQVEVGVCDESGACDEGEVGERRQCEPTEATRSFDPSTHRWTRVSYEPGAEEGPGSSGCAGCRVGASRPPPAAGLLALWLVLAVARRRR